MKKMVLACVCALGLTNIISAQQFSNVIIANGGAFEFSTPYQDRATIGAYDPVMGKYWVFDTIQVESVQDLEVVGNYAYLAAESKVIKYDLTTYERVAEADYVGIRSVSLHDTLLFVGKYFGSGAFLSVYDSRDLSFLYDVTDIDQTVVDVVVVGDTAYVPYNQKGVVDQFPPYFVFSDTIGKIGVVDLINQSFVRDIMLDTIGAGSINAFTYESNVVVTCDVNGVVAKYDVNTLVVDFDTVGVSSAIAMEDSLLIGHFDGIVGTYDFVQGSSTTSLGFSLNSWELGASAYDTLSNQIILTETDFGSYGKAHVYSDAGAFVDTFNVNIAPQAMAINYKTGGFAPIALNDYIETMEDSAGVAIEVLTNDFDPNGDFINLEIIQDPSNGVAFDIFGNSINYTPTIGFFGLDSLMYRVCDATACDSAYLVINVVHISAVEETFALAALELFPNPAINEISISTTMLGTKQVVIYDVKGQIVRSDSFLEGKQTIDVSGLSKGAYIIKITNGKAVELGKLLKE